MSRPFVMLFVDDEPDLRDLMEDYCLGLGITMVSASSGMEGLQKLEEQSFDLVFSDLNMPRMNGLEFLQRVRAQYPEMPFIFWSGFMESKIVSQVRAIGGVEFIEKPFQAGKLKSLLTSVRDRILANPAR